MSIRTRSIWIVAALLTAAPAAAQGSAPSLHSAWLHEVLDLDIRGAAASYTEIAADSQAPALDRLVATARLFELRQQGIGAGSPPADLAVVPELLRQHFQMAESAQPSDPVLQRELEVGAADRDSVRQFLAATELPPLRPLVLPIVLAAAEQADPARMERLRRSRSRFQPWSNDPARVLDRIRANEIVRAELDGRAGDADTMRRRGFPSWKPSPWPDDAAGAWARVRSNLDEWLHERQLTNVEVDLLRRLRATLATAAERDPGAALRLLDGMPLYAERLRVGIAAGH